MLNHIDHGFILQLNPNYSILGYSNVTLTETQIDFPVRFASQGPVLPSFIP